MGKFFCKAHGVREFTPVCEHIKASVLEDAKKVEPLLVAQEIYLPDTTYIDYYLCAECLQANQLPSSGCILYCNDVGIAAGDTASSNSPIEFKRLNIVSVCAVCLQNRYGPSLAELRSKRKQLPRLAFEVLGAGEEAFRMPSDVPDKCGGFIIVLYMLFHIRDVTKHPEFDEKAAQNLKTKYSEDQTTRICDGLTWALNNRDYNFKDVFPGMRFSNEEILYFFEKTLTEMRKAKLCP